MAQSPRTSLRIPVLGEPRAHGRRRLRPVPQRPRLWGIAVERGSPAGAADHPGRGVPQVDVARRRGAAAAGLWGACRAAAPRTRASGRRRPHLLVLTQSRRSPGPESSVLSQHATPLVPGDENAVRLSHWPCVFPTVCPVLESPPRFSLGSRVRKLPCCPRAPPSGAWPVALAHLGALLAQSAVLCST